MDGARAAQPGAKVWPAGLSVPSLLLLYVSLTFADSGEERRGRCGECWTGLGAAGTAAAVTEAIDIGLCARCRQHIVYEGQSTSVQQSTITWLRRSIVHARHSPFSFAAARPHHECRHWNSARPRLRGSLPAMNIERHIRIRHGESCDSS